MRWLFAITILSVCGTANAQFNLVRNGSFEEIRVNNGDTVPPSHGGMVYLADPWKSARGSVDYFNACSNEDWPLYGVPSNFYGAQRPYDGLAYAALTTYTPVYSNAREFLFQKLERPLEAGLGYRVSFWVSLCDSLEFASDGLGALLSVDSTQWWVADDFFNATPQVSYIGEPLSDSVGWYQISGNFIASGGEEYLTIGNFLRDSATNTVRVNDHSNFPFNWESAVYYIDAVELYEDNSIGIAEQETAQLQLYPNPTTSEVALHYTTAHSGPLQWQLTDMAGRVVHEQSLQGPAGRATLGKTLPSGVYISTLRTNEAGLGSIKLVVL